MSGEQPSNPEAAEAFELQQALDEVIDTYLPDDKEWLDDMEFADRLGAVYGLLLEAGEDPDSILEDFNVFDETSNES